VRPGLPDGEGRRHEGVRRPAGCNAVQRACKKECRTQYFGQERRDCYDQCDEAKTECKEHADACKDDCKTEFLSCKIDCVDKGF
jgi:hypothetical protein